jgi:hypothetical protein
VRDEFSDGKNLQMRTLVKQIVHASQPAVWSADKERQPLPVSGDAERPLPDARRDVPGRSEG